MNQKQKFPLELLMANQRTFNARMQHWRKNGAELTGFADIQRFFLACPEGYEVVHNEDAGSPLHVDNLTYRRIPRPKISLSVEDYQYRRNAAANDYTVYRALGRTPLKGVNEIEKFYLACPKDHRVTHIYPIFTDKAVKDLVPVSGLFCVANLTYVKIGSKSKWDKFCDKQETITVDLVSKFGLRWLNIPKNLRRSYNEKVKIRNVADE